MTTLFPANGDSREDQIAARKLARRVLNAVYAAVCLRCGEKASDLRLDVRVSRRAGVGPCIILHRVAGDRNETVAGDWLPWSWPLTAFTPEDEAFLKGGQLPHLLKPCVIEWAKRLRAPVSGSSLSSL